MNCEKKKCMVQDKTVCVKHSQISPLLIFPDAESTLHVLHGQISLCSSRTVETLATYRKLDTTVTHLQYLDISVRLLPLPHINNKSLWNTSKIKSAPIMVSALIHKR